MTPARQILAHPTTIRMAAFLKRGADRRGYADLADLADHYSDAAITAHGPDAFALAAWRSCAAIAAVARASKGQPHDRHPPHRDGARRPRLHHRHRLARGRDPVPRSPLGGIP